MKILFLIALSSLSNYTYSQIRFSGILEDANTGEKIQFAHISFQNSSFGTSSNADGYFELSVVAIAKSDSIQISHINYQAKKISVINLDTNIVNSIKLQSQISTLKEIVVLSKSPYEYLINTIDETKKKLKHPFSSRYYYREVVKDNKDYSKYSDAILIGNFPEDKEDMQVGVEEARVINLPMESDDVLDIVSPVEVSKILKFQYIDLLNRFLGDKKQFYDFQMKTDPENGKIVIYEISPLVRPEKNTLLYYGTILTEDDDIKHIRITSDPLCDWQRTMLGMTAKITSFIVTLNFEEIYKTPVLVHGVVKLEMDFLHKKFTQNNQYLSEFVTLDFNVKSLSELEKRKLLKSKTIYKHGNNYSTKFWEENNIPIRTEEERNLLNKLVNFDKKAKK